MNMWKGRIIMMVSPTKYERLVGIMVIEFMRRSLLPRIACLRAPIRLASHTLM